MYLKIFTGRAEVDEVHGDPGGDSGNDVVDNEDAVDDGPEQGRDSLPPPVWGEMWMDFAWV